MPHPESPQTELDTWAASELCSDELGSLVTFSVGMINLLAQPADEIPFQVDYYQAIAESLDDDSATERIIKLRAFADPEIDDWEYAPLPAWSARIHLDERLVALSGYSKAASLYRRSFIRLEPLLPMPIRVVRTHELRRRSEHRFHKPRNETERNLLRQNPNFERTALVQSDRILIEGVLMALEETTDKAEYVEGESGIDA
jgi:hypothetical protein